MPQNFIHWLFYWFNWFNGFLDHLPRLAAEANNMFMHPHCLNRRTAISACRSVSKWQWEPAAKTSAVRCKGYLLLWSMAAVSTVVSELSQMWKALRFLPAAAAVLVCTASFRIVYPEASIQDLSVYQETKHVIAINKAFFFVLLSECYCGFSRCALDKSVIGHD